MTVWATIPLFIGTRLGLVRHVRFGVAQKCIAKASQRRCKSIASLPSSFLTALIAHCSLLISQHPPRAVSTAVQYSTSSTSSTSSTAYLFIPHRQSTPPLRFSHLLPLLSPLSSLLQLSPPLRRDDPFAFSSNRIPPPKRWKRPTAILINSDSVQPAPTIRLAILLPDRPTAVGHQPNGRSWCDVKTYSTLTPPNRIQTCNFIRMMHSHHFVVPTNSIITTVSKQATAAAAAAEHINHRIIHFIRSLHLSPITK